MSERKLTVSRTFRELSGRKRWQLPAVREVPFLRMKGDWLGVAGFPVGSKVRVQVEPGRLVIEPVSSEGAGDA
ncbi:MAG: SymE family type I addiction module toxin [Acidobacteria bacterium]|nr:SymE family type I addiction module toxin [Acidobacteriota bacterium]